MHYFDSASLEHICSYDHIFSCLDSLICDDRVGKLVIGEIKVMHEMKPLQRLKQAQMLTDFVWERLNTGHWSSVDESWRRLYALLALLKVATIVHLLESVEYSFEKEADVIKDLIKICDIGLLMGAPLLDNACAKLAHYFCKCLSARENESESNLIPAKSKKRKVEEVLLGKHSSVKLVSECNEISIEDFVESYKVTETPVKITNCLDHWPALEENGDNAWNTAYFSRIMGYRTVPVEIGKRYTDDSWTQSLMTVNDFILGYLEHPSPKHTGYLAQHELFHQIPELRDDFDIPLYCYAGEKAAEDEDVAINIWFGPGGTISPLHTDPKHNCLCQVFGQKYVRLYQSSQTEYLYPYNPEDLLSNTSRIDLEEGYDQIVQKFPNFSHATGFECILNPGDILYIPPKCWHFVKSFSTSCSLSFWFE